jgi:predicted amidohydrolase YtcJ
MTQYMKNVFIYLAVLTSISSCSQTQKVDLLIYNAKIFTVDSAFHIAEAIAVEDGKILDIGASKDLTARYFSDNKINAAGKFIFPGFIDAHAHFYRYGLGLQEVNLVGTESWDEIISRVQAFASDKNISPGNWIIGRGWDQNDWTVKEFPTKEKLDQDFPNNPVLLTRIDGHAVIANTKALELAGIKPGQKINGGAIEVKNGQLTGILIDNATDLLGSSIPAPTPEIVAASLQDGQAKCFAVGLTTVDDCGID